MGRWAAAILVLTFTTPAWAEGEDLKMPVPVKVEASTVSATPAAEPTVRPKQKKKQSYRAVLGSLAIARDLQIPGAPVMSVRLLPTSSALAGETTTPIVVRPRVDGGYGVNIAARF